MRKKSEVYTQRTITNMKSEGSVYGHKWEVGEGIGSQRDQKCFHAAECSHETNIWHSRLCTLSEQPCILHWALDSGAGGAGSLRALDQVNLLQLVPPIIQDRWSCPSRFSWWIVECSLGCVCVSFEHPSICATTTGPELQLMLEVVATSISLIIYLGLHIRLLGWVFRGCNRGQVLKFEVEQYVQEELTEYGRQSELWTL